MGAALARLWAAAGHRVLLSYARDPRQLQALAAGLPQARAGTVAEAVAFGEVLLLAVPYPSLDEVLAEAPAFAGKVLLTCVSGLRPDFSGQTTGLPSPRTESVAEEIARRLPGAQVVEAFNTTFAEVLQAPSRQLGGETPSVFYCGDHPAANAQAAALIAECGYQPQDAGPLVHARVLETLATSWVQLAVVTGLFPLAGLRVLHEVPPTTPPQ